MTKKTVEEEYPKFDVVIEVEYEDDGISEIRVKDRGFKGKFKRNTVVKGRHLDALRKLIQNGFPK